MEKRIARAPEAPELDALARLAESWNGDWPELLAAFGHGSPAGVGDAHGNYVLRSSEGGELAGRTVLALACRTAPELCQALVGSGVAAATGYREELRLPKDFESMPDAELQIFTNLLDATAAELHGQGDARLYAAVTAAVSHPWGHRFMLQGFAEQLYEARQVVRRPAPS
jgi:hypothetical protein